LLCPSQDAVSSTSEDVLHYAHDLMPCSHVLRSAIMYDSQKNEKLTLMRSVSLDLYTKPVSFENLILDLTHQFGFDLTGTFIDHLRRAAHDNRACQTCVKIRRVGRDRARVLATHKVMKDSFVVYFDGVEDVPRKAIEITDHGVQL